MSHRKNVPALLAAVAVLLSATGLPAQEVVVSAGEERARGVVPGRQFRVPVRVEESGSGSPDVARLELLVEWNPDRLVFVASAAGAAGTVRMDETGTEHGTLSAVLTGTADAPSSFTALALRLRAGEREMTTRVRVDVRAAEDASGESVLARVRERASTVCVGSAGVFGDVDGGGGVNVLDAQIIARFAAGLPVEAPGRVERVGDVNADGRVNVLDAQQVARFAAGLETTGRIGEAAPVACQPVEMPSARIEELIEAIFPSPERGEAKDLLDAVVRAQEEDRLAEARRKGLELIDLTLETAGEGRLEDPPGEETAEEAASRLVDLVADLVGVEPPEVDPGVLSGERDGTVEVVEPPPEGESVDVVTPEESAGVRIESGDLDETIVVQVRRRQETCLPTELDQRQGCYRFEKSPDGPFEDDVLVAVCPEPSIRNETDPAAEQFQLVRFDPDNPRQGVLPLPSRSEDLLDCSGFSVRASAGDGGWWRAAGEAWSATGGRLLRWLGPSAVEAVNVGFGGSTPDFSLIGWARPLEAAAAAGDGQVAEPGTPVSVDPTVRVTAAHFGPAREQAPAVEGAEVTFRVAAGGGSVGGAGASETTVTTDGEGRASVPWTLGAERGANRLVARLPDGPSVEFTATALKVRRLAHWTDREGNPEISLASNDGSNPRRLTTNPAADFSPAWSPGGGRIAFHTFRDGQGEIYVMDADGSGKTRLTTDPGTDGNPTWSPDGSRIAFVSNRTGSWELFVMDADGTDVRQLTSLSGEGEFGVRGPEWSRDGTEIAFAARRADDPDGDHEIFVVNADGTGLRQLTDNAVFDSWPSWSPDGSRIVFDSTREAGFRRLFVMGADGTNPALLTPDGGATPDWSPDGRRIVFSSIRDGDFELFAVDPDGALLVKITDNAATELQPTWRP